MAATRHPSLRLAIALAACGLLLVAALVWIGWRMWTAAHRPPSPPSRDELLSNATVREWMHALSEEEREVASLQRQQQAAPAVALPPGEALDQEQAQLLHTWQGLCKEWVADGGRVEECPGYGRYHGGLATSAQ